MGGSAPHPPGVFKTPGPRLLGSKGRRPLVGIKRGNAPLASFVHLKFLRYRTGRVEGVWPRRFPVPRAAQKNNHPTGAHGNYRKGVNFIPVKKVFSFPYKGFDPTDGLN